MGIWDRSFRHSPRGRCGSPARTCSPRLPKKRGGPGIGVSDSQRVYRQAGSHAIGLGCQHSARTHETRVQCNQHTRAPRTCHRKRQILSIRNRRNRPTCAGFWLGSVRSTVPESPLSAGQPHPYSHRPSRVASSTPPLHGSMPLHAACVSVSVSESRSCLGVSTQAVTWCHTHARGCLWRHRRAWSVKSGERPKQSDSRSSVTLFFNFKTHAFFKVQNGAHSRPDAGGGGVEPEGMARCASFSTRILG